MLKRFLALVTVLLFAVVTLTGCGGGKTEQTTTQPPKAETPEKLKVAFIYVGPVGDAGWTYAHDMGRKYLQDNVANVETSYVESVPEGADAERVLEDLVQKGNKVIFATSFGFMDPVIKVAAKHPDVVFMHCSGFKTAKNVGTYFGRDYQARFLAGMVAGKASKTGNIGYVGAFDIPEVVRGLNAFTLGARSVNSKAKVKVVWTQTWFNPVTEKEAAKSLLQQGADVIAQHQDTPGPQQAAEDAGKLSIGYNTDMRQFAPKAVMTGPVWNWGPYYAQVVKSVQDKTWKSDQYWGPIADGIIDLGPYGPMVGKDVQDLVAAKRQEIIDGKFDVFKGPLKDNTGKERVPAGQVMTDKEMLEFKWLVEGVDGTLLSK